jgi:chemotaxis signal transduction protein
MHHGTSMSEVVVELRQAFDAVFAAPREAPLAIPREFFLFRTGGHRYGFRLQELSGLANGRRVTRLPSSDAALLGIAGMQGRIIPVFDLRPLLGLDNGSERPSWFVISRGVGQEVGLAFERMEGYAQVADGQEAAVGAESPQRHVLESIVWSGVPWSILSMVSMVAALQRRAGRPERHNQE